MHLLNDLPSLYEGLLPDTFNMEIPSESFATCSNCTMVCQEKPHSSNNFYSPNVKCCTYHPNLPNYLTGYILESNDTSQSEGRLRIAKKIAERIGVFPSGIYPSKRYQSLYKNYGSSVFGKTEELLCPYYIRSNGNCSIWKAREAVCSTYFCVHTGGTKGRDFWRAVNIYLLHVQESLVCYTQMELNMNLHLQEGALFDHGGHLSIEDFDETTPTEELYGRVWKQYVGKEIEFYKECHRIVTSLSRTGLTKIIGVKGKALLNEVRSRKNELEHVPDVLIKNPKSNSMRNQDSWNIQLGKSKSHLNISDKLVSLFDGKLTTKQVARLAKSRGIDAELFDEKVYVLFHHDFLIKP